MNLDRNQVRSDIETRMVESLLAVDVTHSPASRALLQDMLADQLGDLALRTQSKPRHWAWELLRQCLIRPGGLDALVTVVGQLSSGADESHQLCRLRDEHEALDVLSPSDWDLKPLLSTTTPTNLGLLYQRATEHRIPGPPAWCANSWDVLAHLAGRNAPSNGLRPSTRFLELIAGQLGDQIAERIRRRNEEEVRSLDLTSALDRERSAIAHGAGLPTSGGAYLVIQIEPDLRPRSDDDDDPETYYVSYYRQWRGPESWHASAGPRLLVNTAALESAVENIIDQMETEWSDLSGQILVEFVLPWELLNADVDWWRRETASTRPTVLAMDYPIVVRSLERLRTERWHRNWHLRWTTLRSGPAHVVVHTSRPAGKDYFTRLERDIKADPRIVSLVLSEPPGGTGSIGQQEAEAAMRAGLPVLIWHRKDCQGVEFRETVAKLTADGAIAELPSRLMDLRLAALGEEPDARDGHIGRHVAVLWDDPERKPSRLASPAFDGRRSAT